MRATISFVLLTIVARAHGKDSTDKLADRLFDLPAESTDLDHTTLQKSAAHLAAPGALRPQTVIMGIPAMRTSVAPQSVSMPARPGVLRAPVVAKSSSSDSSSRDLGEAVKDAATGRWAWNKDNFNFEYGHVDMTYEEVPSSEVTKMMEEGWTLLDVRSPEQVERAQVTGALQIPLFVIQNDKSPLGLYKEMASFGLGGWWMGGRPMTENTEFVQQVIDNVPKDSGIIVACQSGLRAKQAMKQLTLAGFTKLAWLVGGYNRVQPGELPVEGGNLRTAGSGNIAGMLGWQSS